LFKILSVISKRKAWKINQLTWACSIH